MENRHIPNINSSSTDSDSDESVSHEDQHQQHRELPPPYTFSDISGQGQSQQFPIRSQPQSQSQSQSDLFAAQSFGNISTITSISNHSQGVRASTEELNERHPSVESLKTIRHLFVKLAGKAVKGIGTLNIEKENGDILYLDKVSAYGYEHSLTDPSSGKILMRLQKETNTMQVECMGQRLGFVHNNNTMGKSYSVTSILTGGQSNFLIQGSNTFGLTYFPGLTKGEFRILSSNGELIGTMNKTYGTFGLSFPPDMDTNSKILLLAAGIMIYIGYFADTGCSTSGVRGMNCFCCNLAVIPRF